ncbi:Piso0_002443 [Millerozyma farinosa CBS 7064]|uniref:Piso0_002443 protein n=1 Tax=Pichia sorbitophila (strain ATCC MYA-4447 / BCRC 22081 / CBS 7064 / NBRC 10061 / NRRL Y-12695) TaxID=559304 RepID=G8YCM1_PICSO|nr:Piso0_002443 [Millerozyma farinosa CBS 7064]
MSDEEGLPPHLVEQGGLDYPLRAIIVHKPSGKDEGEMEEAMLDSVQTFDEVDAFFDKFDQEIAMPNEGKIKYEVGSDGLVVIIAETVEVKNSILDFIEKYITTASNREQTEKDDKNGSEATKDIDDDDIDNTQQKKKRRSS